MNARTVRLLRRAGVGTRRHRKRYARLNHRQRTRVRARARAACPHNWQAIAHHEGWTGPPEHRTYQEATVYRCPWCGESDSN